MSVALLALRLMCLAWMWPLTQLNSSSLPDGRRQQEVNEEEKDVQKEAGWVRKKKVEPFSAVLNFNL